MKISIKQLRKAFDEFYKQDMERLGMTESEYFEMLEASDRMADKICKQCLKCPKRKKANICCKQPKQS